ncbi:MAG TPA: allantoate amidohydrolase [Pilimelia sp.]|nr:allantoate amidohydrolase [Pilimelia sp.]
MTPDRFRALWDTLAPIGRDPVSGGYLRYAWTEAELACRRWFAAQAAARRMPVEEDGNGNLFAWWTPAGSGAAVVTGSHFDSVPQGGAYDGPLGIAGGFLAVDELRDRGVSPVRPVAVAAFAEEEGARFGVPCLGSRLLTGALDPARAGALTDRDGVMLSAAMGAPPAGAQPELLDRVGCFVELHVEQGRALDPLGAPIGVGQAIWPHGRWRVEITGEANHAGTTLMTDRRDPMLTYAHLVLIANKEARLRGAHATVGRVAVEPNATNAVPSRVRAWVDARAADTAAVAALLAAIESRLEERAARDGTEVRFARESYSPVVAFDDRLVGRLAEVLGDAPVLPTAAGHDAGVLAAHVPTAMLFVRNPTGVSHAPTEAATDADCAAGVDALATALAELACRP